MEQRKAPPAAEAGRIWWQGRLSMVTQEVTPHQPFWPVTEPRSRSCRRSHSTAPTCPAASWSKRSAAAARAARRNQCQHEPIGLLRLAESLAGLAVAEGAAAEVVATVLVAAAVAAVPEAAATVEAA